MSKKKSKADIEKMVDAQARGKALAGARNKKSAPKGELDARVSKASGKFSIEID